MKRSPMPPRETPLSGTLRGLTSADLPAGVTLRRVPMKKRRCKTTPARKAAKDKPCMIRIPGVCNGNPETTVLCHYRLGNYNGAGLKPDDSMAAWGCSDCHSMVDGRTKRPDDCSYAELRLMHAEGCFRTQRAILEGFEF